MAKIVSVRGGMLILDQTTKVMVEERGGIQRRTFDTDALVMRTDGGLSLRQDGGKNWIRISKHRAPVALLGTIGQ